MASSPRRAIAILLCGTVILSAPGTSVYAQTVRVVVGQGAGAALPAVQLQLGTAEFGAAMASPLTAGGVLPSASGGVSLQTVGPLIHPQLAVKAELIPLSLPLARQTAARRVQAPESAMGLARQAASFEVTAQSQDLTPEIMRVSGAEVFDNEGAAPYGSGVAMLGRTRRNDPLAPPSSSRVEGKRLSSVGALARAAADAARRDPRVQWAAALGIVLLASIIAPSLAAGGLALPVIIGSCNAMREREQKNRAIRRNDKDEKRRERAKQELDAALVNFGKKLKAEADRDVRVTSLVIAHAAEHAMENPILDRLTVWDALWASGKGLTKEEARRELYALILTELKRTTLPNESPELIEELLKKTGSWQAFLTWEENYEILDSLKAAAQEEATAAKKEHGHVQTKSGLASALGSNGATVGLFLIGAIGLAAALITAPPLLAMAMLGMIVSDGAGPTPPPVPLDSYLKSVGLTADDITFLKLYTTDIGARDLAPIIGRSKELERVITILSKPPGTQNNPMMLGDKGVGKTAIVEAVAKYVYQNELPSLRGKRILELDTGLLTAGSGQVGEMEKRLTTLRAILAKTNNKVILFVDEMHSLLKNVATANAVPDLLKSPLRNGEMTVIGATTVGEFRKYVEQDPAFADRFDAVQVDEPTLDEAIEMLEGDLEYLERKFDVAIDPEAASAAVKLSARYIPEKFLPRKARVLLENSIAAAKPEAARDGVKVQVDTLTDRLRLLIKRYAILKNQAVIGRKADETQAYNRIVGVYSAILELEVKQGSFKAEKIGTEHVMRMLAKETGIKLGELGEDEYKRLLRMEPWFKERIVGQDEAIKALASTVRTNKAGISDPGRPQGVFLFAGKTGVGKTALARTLAEFLFSNPEAVIRIDMSEYMEKFGVQRLFGAPPGYVGYDSGGELTEKVRRQPYSVILFDEIEKAHPDVLNALLQIFDAGRMTDGRQNTVNFKNTIIIMTTNLGSASANEGAEFKADILEAVKARLRPEFVNRIDKTVIFNPLSAAQAPAIVSIMVSDVEKRLREQGLKLEVSPDALDFLSKKGFDPAYGARPLKRVVENDVTNAVGEFLLRKRAEGALVNGGVLAVIVKDGAIAFHLRPNSAAVIEPATLPEGPAGNKLRRILEDAVAGSDSTKDLPTFRAVLFPDRGVVTLEPSLGAFQPNNNGGLLPRVSPLKMAGTAPGMKDAEFERIKSEVIGNLAGRWTGATGEEAAEAWLTAFARLAKQLSPAEPPTVSARYPGPKRDGTAEFSIEVKADAGFSAVQRFARLARDHFAVPMADESAVRARAASLKDEGRAVQRDLLDLKRLIESAEGLSFGFIATEGTASAPGTWNFWFKAPVKEEPPPPPPPAPEPVRVEKPAAVPITPLPAAPAPSAAPVTPATASPAPAPAPVEAAPTQPVPEMPALATLRHAELLARLLKDESEEVAEALVDKIRREPEGMDAQTASALWRALYNSLTNTNNPISSRQWPLVDSLFDAYEAYLAVRPQALTNNIVQIFIDFSKPAKGQIVVDPRLLVRLQAVALFIRQTNPQSIPLSSQKAFDALVVSGMQGRPKSLLDDASILLDQQSSPEAVVDAANALRNAIVDATYAATPELERLLWRGILAHRAVLAKLEDSKGALSWGDSVKVGGSYVPPRRVRDIFDLYRTLLERRPDLIPSDIAARLREGFVADRIRKTGTYDGNGDYRYRYQRQTSSVAEWALKQTFELAVSVARAAPELLSMEDLLKFHDLLADRVRESRGWTGWDTATAVLVPILALASPVSWIFGGTIAIWPWMLAAGGGLVASRIAWVLARNVRDRRPARRLQARMRDLVVAGAKGLPVLRVLKALAVFEPEAERWYAGADHSGLFDKLVKSRLDLAAETRGQNLGLSPSGEIALVLDAAVLSDPEAPLHKSVDSAKRLARVLAEDPSRATLELERVLRAAIDAAVADIGKANSRAVFGAFTPIRRVRDLLEIYAAMIRARPNLAPAGLGKTLADAAALPVSANDSPRANLVGWLQRWSIGVADELEKAYSSNVSLRDATAYYQKIMNNRPIAVRDLFRSRGAAFGWSLTGWITGLASLVPGAVLHWASLTYPWFLGWAILGGTLAALSAGAFLVWGIQRWRASAQAKALEARVEGLLVRKAHAATIREALDALGEYSAEKEAWFAKQGFEKPFKRLSREWPDFDFAAEKGKR